MKIGIVGYGTMGAAIARGLLAAGAAQAISAYDKVEERRREAARDGVRAAPTLEALLAGSEVLLVAVKPQDLEELLAAAGRHPGRRVLSIVAGRSIDSFERALGTRDVARLMPNIAATRGASYVGVSCHPAASAELRSTAMAVAGAIGLAVEVPERLLAAVTGVAGSGIAFVLAFIDAMAMGAVHAGMDYPRALAAVVQTVRGAAALLDAGEHPAALVSRVTSPAGTTIEGILELESGAFAAAVMRAVKAAADRAVELERPAG